MDSAILITLTVVLAAVAIGSLVLGLSATVFKRGRRSGR